LKINEYSLAKIKEAVLVLRQPLTVTNIFVFIALDGHKGHPYITFEGNLDVHSYL